MGKQTENNKNKSSKKNYSFTGHRIIGENKAKHLNESDSNTTDDMLKVLESEQSFNHNMMAQPVPGPQNPMMNQMQQMQQMQMMNSMGPQVPQMNPLMMNQMGPNINQFMGAADVDPLMVNTLAPVNNMKNDFGFDPNGLMNSSQMVQNISGLNNLAQLGNNNFQMANQYATNAMSETNMMGMNNMGIMENSKPFDANSLRNLSNLYSMNIIKQ